LTSAEIDQAFTHLKPGADIDVRGVRFSARILDRLKAAVTDTDGKPVFGTAIFSGARFEDTAPFSDARFNGDACFDGVQFAADATFRAVTFGKNASFAEAQFEGDARFPGVIVKGDATFRSARFTSAADFAHATFHRDASFSGAAFSDEALGPVAVRDVLDLDSTVFKQKVTVEAAASCILARRASFAGATLLFDFAEVCLDQVTTSESLTVVAASRDDGPRRPPHARQVSVGAVFVPGGSNRTGGGFGLHFARETARRWLGDLALVEPADGRGAMLRLTLRTLIPDEAPGRTEAAPAIVERHA
jgi:uncharacterized protein YjbI with pentapeptide repeats